jgi:hypothetical protein
MARRDGHLYRDGARKRELAEFEERYGREHGKEVYGATVGKVAREQAAERGGEKVEEIPTHYSERNGKRFEVRAHEAVVVAHPHSRGEHSGRCSAACRRGEIGHRHRRPRK